MCSDKNIFVGFEKTSCDEGEFNFYSSAFKQEFVVSVELNYETEAYGPNEKQRETFVWFERSQNEIRRHLESVIFNIYCDSLPEIRSSWGIDADRYCPVLSDSSQIWSLLSKPKIGLLSEYADFFISFSASWDPEHGVTILFEDQKIKKIE